MNDLKNPEISSCGPQNDQPLMVIATADRLFQLAGLIADTWLQVMKCLRSATLLLMCSQQDEIGFYFHLPLEVGKLQLSSQA